MHKQIADQLSFYHSNLRIYKSKLKKLATSSREYANKLADVLKYNVKKDSQFESANQANDELNNYVTYLLSLCNELSITANKSHDQLKTEGNSLKCLKKKVDVQIKDSQKEMLHAQTRVAFNNAISSSESSNALNTKLIAEKQKAYNNMAISTENSIMQDLAQSVHKTLDESSKLLSNSSHGIHQYLNDKLKLFAQIQKPVAFSKPPKGCSKSRLSISICDNNKSLEKSVISMNSRTSKALTSSKLNLSKQNVSSMNPLSSIEKDSFTSKSLKPHGASLLPKRKFRYSSASED